MSPGVSDKLLSSFYFFFPTKIELLSIWVCSNNKITLIRRRCLRNQEKWLESSFAHECLTELISLFSEQSVKTRSLLQSESKHEAVWWLPSRNMLTVWSKNWMSFSFASDKLRHVNWVWQTLIQRWTNLVFKNVSENRLSFYNWTAFRNYSRMEILFVVRVHTEFSCHSHSSFKCKWIT